MTRWADRRRETEDSFREAFVELFPKAYRLGLRLLGNRAAAEDAAAEAMARAFARWRAVRELPHRDAWVLRVTSNIAIDVVRRRAPVVEPPDALDESDVATTRIALAAALRALPNRQRDAVVLRYLNDYSEAEVAEALGISPGTVKTHLRRGLDALRAKIGDEFGRTTLVT